MTAEVEGVRPPTATEFAPQEGARWFGHNLLRLVSVLLAGWVGSYGVSALVDGDDLTDLRYVVGAVAYSLVFLLVPVLAGAVVYLTVLWYSGRRLGNGAWRLMALLVIGVPLLPLMIFMQGPLAQRLMFLVTVSWPLLACALVVTRPGRPRGRTGLVFAAVLAITIAALAVMSVMA